jgi:hypothetical protein
MTRPRLDRHWLLLAPIVLAAIQLTLATVMVQRLKQDREVLYGATLIVHRLDARQAAMADRLKADWGIGSFHSDSTRAGEIVRGLGLANLKTPALVTEDGRAMIQGYDSVVAALRPLIDPNHPPAAGARALIAMVAVLGLVIVLGPLIVKMGPCIPFAGMVIAAALPIACRECAGFGTLSGSGPLYAVTAFLLVFVSCLFQPLPPAKSAPFSLLVMLPIVVAPAFMQLHQPKFCALCLGVYAGALAVLYQAVGQPNVPSGHRKVQYPKSWVVVGLAFCTLVLARSYSAILVGVAADARPRINESTNLLQFLRSRDLKTGLLLFTLPGCPACDDAKSFLKANRVAYTEVVPCDARAVDGCFDTKAARLVAPSFVFADPKGNLVYQKIGWPIEEADRLEMLNALRKIGGSYEKNENR